MQTETRDYEYERSRAQRRTKGLGWFSIGLGIAGLFAPGSVARLIGVRDNARSRHMLQTVGVREISSGVAILTNPDSAGAVWSRVAGDVMDLGLLGLALKSEEVERDRLLAATAAVAGITVIDALSAAQVGRANANGNGASIGIERSRLRESRTIRLVRAVTVNRPRAEVYAFWKDFENLPRFFQHLESVRTEGGRSRWKAKLVGSSPLEWEAEIIVDRPNESIEWRSFESGDMASRGAVHFLDAPGGRGTEVRVELEYEPRGVLAASFRKLFGQLPAQQIANDLRWFKQLMEVGEIVHSDASLHRGMHPARPPSTRELQGKEATS